MKIRTTTEDPIFSTFHAALLEVLLEKDFLLEVLLEKNFLLEVLLEKDFSDSLISD